VIDVSFRCNNNQTILILAVIIIKQFWFRNVFYFIWLLWPFDHYNIYRNKIEETFIKISYFLHIPGASGEINLLHTFYTGRGTFINF